MIAATDLNARGVRVRQALDVLRVTVTAPQQALSVAYAYAAFSNLMIALEQDYGVQPGFFGSFGAALQEINPFSGVPMPEPISGEPTTPQFIPAALPPTPEPPPTSF